MTIGDPAYEQQRQRMVEEQLRQRGIHDPAVLAAFAGMPRHFFVPAAQREHAYEDYPLPIGAGQTISQPYVVAYMLQALQLTPAARVLEIGTGSGYQTALLAALVSRVYTIEFFAALALRAQQVFGELGYGNIEWRIGDGNRGWREQAPFDAIIGSAAAPRVPPQLLAQLGTEGRLILPVGRLRQHLVLCRRTAAGIQQAVLLPVRFVPMQGSTSQT